MMEVKLCNGERFPCKDLEEGKKILLVKMKKYWCNVGDIVILSKGYAGKNFNILVCASIETYDGEFADETGCVRERN